MKHHTCLVKPFTPDVFDNYESASGSRALGNNPINTSRDYYDGGGDGDDRGGDGDDRGGDGDDVDHANGIHPSDLYDSDDSVAFRQSH